MPLGAFGGHLSRYAIAQKILKFGYFWPTIFHNCILVVQKFHVCQIYDRKFFALPSPLHPIFTASPFAKWGINFITCNPNLTRGYGYIIVVVDYFTKWVKVMPTFNNTGKLVAYVFFNHVISRFGVLQ